MTNARPRAAILLLAMALLPRSAFAQDSEQPPGGSRAAVLAAEREKKFTAIVPPRRSKVEHALYLYDNWAGLPFVMLPWHGFQLGGGRFPAGAGTKLGAGFTHDLGRARPAGDSNSSNRLEFDAIGAYSTRGYLQAASGLSVYRLGGAPIELRVRARHDEFPQQDFFGFGQDSEEGNRTNYLLRNTEGSADVQWRPARLLELGGGVAYLNPDIGSGTDDRFPSTQSVSGGTAIPGFVAQPDFIRSDASVALDWRDNPLHPHGGGRYGVRFSEYRDQDLNAFGFHRVAVDVQQYVPLPDRYRTLALHAFGAFTDPRAGQQVPFYFQPTLGGAQALRGFREFRFQDRNSMLLTAEYRWEAWWALDGALFVDAGQVARERRDFRLRDFDVSYGVGFRLHSNSAFVARLDLAFSREGFIPLLRFEHAF